MSPLTLCGIESFAIEEHEVTGDITASITSESNHVLIWMKSSERNKNDCNYNHFNEGNQRSLHQTTFETQRNTPYVICAARISQEKIRVQLPNCRAHTTLPSPEDRPLLLTKEKYITLAISCFVLLVIVIVSGAISYSVVLYNPIILKGNKRVIVVHRHECKVRLPQHGENDNPRSSQTTYSTVSTGEASYVTLVEPTNVEQIAWKFREMCDKLSDCKTESAVVFFREQEPAPLPLYRRSYTSHTTCYTEPNSEISYVTINEPTTVRVMAWLFNQTRDEMTDNCMTEGANESHI
jgi:hypothetical protein